MKHDNKPLTLEELKQMDGQPVWIEIIPHPEESKWRLFEYNSNDFMFFSGMDFELCSLHNITWRAYAQKPIDLDDWTAEWKEYTGADAGFHYCSNCGQQAFNYEEDGEVIEVLSNFCPSCGKAMNDEARKTLENRLAGQNNEQ